jgi:hypothetical protein
MSELRYKSYDFYRSMYADKTARGIVLVADSATINNAIAVRNARHAIYVQRIMLAVTTDAAQSLTFQDDNGTPKVVGKSAASPGLGVEVVADYGPEGIALTTGTNLDIVISGAGLACGYVVEAYERLVLPATPDNA